MAYATPLKLLTLAAALVSLVTPVAADSFSWMDEPGFDPGEYMCLTAAIINRVDEVEADQLERAAWILKNRSDSADYPSSYCELAGEVAKPGPWTANQGLGLVQEVMRAEFGSDRYKASAAGLEAYRAQVNTYRMAQVAAYKLMFGWYEEDPTNGATDLAPDVADTEEG